MSSIQHEGDFEAFARRMFPRLAGVARLLLSDRSQAEDLVQETLARMYAKRARVREPEAYAFTTLTRLGRRWRYRGAHEYAIAAIDEPSIDHDEADRIAVDAALSALPRRQRETLVLRYFADLSVEQAAAVMGCSGGTVKSQTARGLDAMRRLLDDSDHSSPSTAVLTGEGQHHGHR